MNKLRNYAQISPNISGEMMTVKAYVERMSLQRRTVTLTPKSARVWFYADELAKIYKFPKPVYATSASNVTVGVVSFGGGLTGNVSSEGVLTDGDVQAYWTALGIAKQNHPRVIIKTINGAKNNPISVDDDGTAENTLDVETIGACCPTSNLTIILYIAPNSLAEFTNVLNYINTSPVVVSGTSYLPSIVSISWGLTEIYYGSHLANINNVLKSLSAKGVNVCVATGDYGSSNGTDSNNVDFPSSSPFVIACGGTSLICPNLTYDAETIETGWTGSGGGVSVYFNKPDYQSALSTSKRATPDIALNADPSTGVAFYIFKKWHIYGGTSVAAPTFAAYLAALNATTFANTKLYTAPSTNFNDIKSGINGAFSARAGYDNVTGLGSIVGNLLAPVLTTINVPVSKIQLNNLQRIKVQLTNAKNPAIAGF
jgi:kumamolisin